MVEEFDNLERQEQEFSELLARFSENEKESIEKAFLYAKEVHTGQVRHATGTPYIIHPVRAAIILIQDLGVTDADLIAAMLLHDVVEDTVATSEGVHNRFGNRVGDLVDSLTRLAPPRESEEQKKRSKPAKFKWYIGKATKEVQMLKAVDILDNVRSWRTIGPEHPITKKFPRWFAEIIQYGIPLAGAGDTRLAQMLVDEIKQYKEDPYFSQFVTTVI